MGGLALHAIYGALLLSPPQTYQQLTSRNPNDDQSIDQVIRPIDHQIDDSLNQEEGDRIPHECRYQIAMEGADRANVSFWDAMYERMALDARLLKERYFLLITLTYVSYIMANVTLLMILPDYVVSLGYGRSQAILLLSFFSATDLVGRLLPGWLSCCSIPVSNKAVYVCSIVAMGFLLFAFPLALNKVNLETGWTLLLTLTLCCGFVSGCQMILPAVMAAEMLGHKNTAMAFAFSNFICGFFSFSRPFIFRKYALQPIPITHSSGSN